MRKNSMVFITLVLLSLLLVGCVGGGAGVINPTPPVGPNPPIETDPDAIFDGSPTHLSLVFERNVPEISALCQNEDELTAYVGITRTENRVVVYDVKREVKLDPNAKAFSLENELPAEKGYSAKVIVLGEKSEFVEFGSLSSIDAPAETITTARVGLEKPEYTLVVPDKMYSGGDVRQFRATTPEHHENYAFVHVYLGLSPWHANGLGDPDGWLINHSHGNLPAVTEPTKLYYQVRVSAARHLFPEGLQWPYHFEPNLELGEELSYIWVYPYPGWEDENPGWQPE